MKLLVRPRPINGESWPSFLTRLATANHLRGVQDVTALFGESPQRFLCTRSPADVLSQMGYGFDPSLDFPIPTNTEKKSSPASAGRTVVTRLCPDCVEAMPVFHVPSLWDSALYLYCSKHKRLLIDQCPSCHSSISYLQPDLRRCTCGLNFLGQSPAPMDFDLDSALHALSLPPIQSQSRSTFAPSTEHEIHAAWLLGRLHVIQLGTRGELKITRNRGNAFLSHADFSKVSPLFQNWPEEFLQQLNQATRQSRVGPVVLLSVRDSNFGVHFPRISALFSEHRIRRQRESQINRTNTDSGGSISLSDYKTETWIGIRAFVTLTGCSQEKVRQLIHTGRLTDIRTTHYKNGRLRLLINRQSADPLIQEFRSSVSARSIANAIGFPSKAILALAFAGEVRGIPYGEVFRKLRVIPDEVHEYMQSLMKAAIQIETAHPDGKRLSKFIVYLHSFHRPLLVPFMQAVCDGKVIAYIAGSTHPTVDEIYVRKSDAKVWMRDRRTTK